MNIVQNILNLTKQAKISNQQLCKLLNTNPNKIYDWKVGKSKPSAEDILVLADYLDCSVDYLLGRDAERKKSPSLDGLEDEAEKQLIQFFRSLNETGREKILDYTVDLVNAGRYKKLDNVQNEA